MNNIHLHKFNSKYNGFHDTRHTRLVMLMTRDLNKNKTVPANFNLLCEGQKGHNTGQKGHNTGQKGLLRVKETNEAIQDKRAEGAAF